MTAWTPDELPEIGVAAALKSGSPRRDDTLRNPVTLWVVRHGDDRHGDDLYVRSVNGRTAAWFRGAKVCHKGRIQVGSVEKDVTPGPSRRMRRERGHSSS